MEQVPLWLTIITTIGTLFAGGFGTWLIMMYKAKTQVRLDETKLTNEQDMARRKQEQELKMSEMAQAFVIYKDVVQSLRGDVGKLSEDMNKVEENLLNCREENATLRAENKAKDREIESLRGQNK